MNRCYLGLDGDKWSRGWETIKRFPRTAMQKIDSCTMQHGFSCRISEKQYDSIQYLIRGPRNALSFWNLNNRSRGELPRMRISTPQKTNVQFSVRSCTSLYIGWRKDYVEEILVNLRCRKFWVEADCLSRWQYRDKGAVKTKKKLFWRSELGDLIGSR